MEGFQSFKREPLTREQLEKDSTEAEALRKTGEILRGMQDEALGEPGKIEEVSGRDARVVQALENEIREIGLYAKNLPGYEELRTLNEERTGMSEEQVALALKEFDRMFPGTRKEIMNGAQQVRDREETIERIKAKKEPEIPFKKAA